MADEKFVAIDFGTCNSYISHITDSGSPKPVNLSTGGSSKLEGIQTAVLYYNAGPFKGDVRFGINALDEYLGASKQERLEYGMRLALNFKPDIGFSEQARKDSVTFLKCLLDAAKKAKLTYIIPSETNNVQVTFGIPSEASRDGNARTKGAFSEALIKIAEQAGWGKVRLLDEPFGPLFYNYRDTDIREARVHILKDKFLVIDFGGGTCDFTILSDGKILKSWGDMCLGGRLFDDLFYQWTLELSDLPDYNEQDHIQNGMDGYFRDYVCRVMKEDFSVFMIDYGKAGSAWKTSNPYLCKTGTRLSFTWDDFIKRARKYKSSDSFCQAYKDLLNVNPQLTDFKIGQEIDLLQWFENKLLYGLHESGIDPKDIDHVLIAGGSSTWFFVSDTCEKWFSGKIERCANVFEAIASGLVAYTNIKKNAANAMRKLENSKDDFIKKLSEETIESLLIDKDKGESSPVVTNLGTRIFDELAVPVLRDFAKDGGAMKDLEKKMESFVKENPDKINRWLSSAMKDTTIKINQHVNDELIKWFNENGVPATEFKCQDAELPIFKMDQTDVNPFSSGTKWLEFGLGFIISSTLSAAIIWALYAFGALAAVQPWLWPALVPWLIGGGVILIITAVVTGSMTIKDAVEKISLPSSITSWLIDEKQIGKMREEFLKKFSEEFPATYNKLVNEQSDNIKLAVQTVVENELKEYNRILEMES